MREIFKLFGVLTAVCFVAALALALVHNLTKQPIIRQRRLKVMRALSAVLPPFDNEPDKEVLCLSAESDVQGHKGPITFYLGREGGHLKGLAFKVSSKEGFGGNIEMMMGVTPDGEITGIEILSMAETPGLGARINSPEYKAVFKHKALTNVKWALKKDGGDIDQITGASISSRAVVAALKRGLEFFKNNYRKLDIQEKDGTREELENAEVFQ
ncbi:MAG: RnfABCDGE type electron transport complex subunit G [bacterium]